MSKSISEITLYDLMAQDYNIWIKKNKCFGFDLQLDTDDVESAVAESGIHPVAMEGFAELCRSFLHFYDRLEAV
jgi:hypothetical protein